MSKRHHTAWLIWLGLLIASGGGLLYWAITTQETQQMGDQKTAIMVVAMTIILSGVCFISSTANWWLRR